MMESKTDDGDDDEPVVVLQCRVETCRLATMPASFWFKLVMFLTWSDDSSAMHATSKAVRDHTFGGWQRIRHYGAHTLLCFVVLDDHHCQCLS